MYIQNSSLVTKKYTNKEILSTPICQELFELYYLIKFSQSYHRWENWGTRSLSDTPEVIQLAKREESIWLQEV